jgi:hypothetical protein
MTPERRVAMTRLGLRLKHGAWQLHSMPQIPDATVDALAEANWQALVRRWRRHRVR